VHYREMLSQFFFMLPFLLNKDI